jgi:hypothetical protein
MCDAGYKVADNSALKHNDTDNGIMSLLLWFRHNQKIMLETYGTYTRGYLQLTLNGTWTFITLKKSCKIHTSHPHPNLAFYWFDRVARHITFPVKGCSYISFPQQMPLPLKPSKSIEP